VVKKGSFSMVERGLVKKVSFSSMEMSVVKKSISAWLDWAKKLKILVQKVVKSCQKIVTKLSNFSANLEKINKKEITNFFENWS
jgi:hypothetical protein